MPVAALKDLAVLTRVFNFVLGPPSPEGSRGRVRTVSFLRKSGGWADSGPDPGVNYIFDVCFGPRRS